MPTGAHVCLWISVLAFFGKMLRSGIAGVHRGSVFIFLRNLYIAFLRGVTNFHFHPLCVEALLFLLHIETFYWPSAGRCQVRWLVVWICISLMVSDAAPLFMCWPHIGLLW